MRAIRMKHRLEHLDDPTRRLLGSRQLVLPIDLEALLLAHPVRYGVELDYPVNLPNSRGSIAQN